MQSQSVCIQFVWEERWIYRRFITNYVTFCLQTYKGSIHLGQKTGQIKLRGSRRISFPCSNQTKECEALSRQRSSAESVRKSAEARYPRRDKCLWVSWTAKEKWHGSTNRCQSPILPAFEFSQVKKSLMWGSLSWGSWLQAASGAGCLCSWLQVKSQDSVAGLGAWTQV